MTDTTTVAPASIEHVISQAIAAMRARAAAAGTGEYWEDWSREALDRRPLILVAAVMPGQTFAWVMEPGMNANADGALYTAAHHLRRTDDPEAIDIDLMTDVDIVRKSMPLATVERGVSWLMRDLTGEFLSD